MTKTLPFKGSTFPLVISGVFATRWLRQKDFSLEDLARCFPDLTIKQVVEIQAGRSSLTGNSREGFVYREIP